MAHRRQCIRGLAALLAAPFLFAAAQPGDDLRAAARKGNTQQVESLLQRGVPIDSPDKDGRTALMLAAQRGRTATVKLLLDRGANPNARDRQGWTAYALALIEGREDVVKLFPKRPPIRIQVEASTGPNNVYSSCSMAPQQLAHEIAALRLDTVVTSALRDFSTTKGNGVVEFVNSEPQARLVLTLRPAVSCVQQQSADNISLAIDAKELRARDNAMLLEKTFGGGLKGLHAQSATSPAQYQPVFADWAKAHAPAIYWAAVEAWLRAR